ncbi:MAG: N-6 DNA methylase [Longimicrobiales bacterium]
MADFAAALRKRGSAVDHDGRPGRPDGVIDLGDLVVVVEVASRSGADAASEYLAIRDHRDLVEQETGKPAHLLFTCWATPDRIIRAIREENSARAAVGKRGRSLFLDLRSLEQALKRLAETAKDRFPAVRWDDWFGAWENIGDDVVALEKLQKTVFAEDDLMEGFVAAKVRQRVQLEQEALRTDVQRLENLLRHRNVTGLPAMKALVYVMFVKLYEEKREAAGEENRFTEKGFADYRKSLSAHDRKEYADRSLQHLIVKEIGLDPDVEEAGILAGVSLPRQITDDFVQEKALPLLERYRFRGTHLDALGAVFEAIARRAEKDNRIGQFFTPEPIVRFAVDVTRPGPEEVVLDPAAGTGRFLTNSMEVMRDRADEVSGKKRAEVVASIHARQLLGTDADDWIVTIAKMNMYIHGDGKSNIRHENGLFLADLDVFPGGTGTIESAIDACLTNPPLGEMSYQAYASDLVDRKESSVTDAGAWMERRLPLLPGGYAEHDVIASAALKVSEWKERYESAVRDEDDGEKAKAERWIEYHHERKAEAEAALSAGTGTYEVLGTTAKGGALFLAAIHDYLKPDRDPGAVEEWKGGRVAIIVDEAILNTPEYAATRRYIRKHYFIKAVFSFYRDAFWYQARTTAKTSLLYLYRKPDPTVVQVEPIFYAHIEKIGFTRTGQLDESELPAMLDAYQRHEEALRGSYKGHSFQGGAARNKIEKIRMPFSVRLRWSPREDEDGGRLDYAYEAARQIRETLPADHLVLGDVAEVVVREPPEDPLGIYHFATVERNTGEVKPKELTDTQYSTADLRLIKAGDIVVSGIDLVNGAVGYATTAVEDMVVSKEFYILRVRDDAVKKVDPRFLALLLRTPNARELVAGTVTGTSNRTRIEDEAALLGLPLPKLPPLKTQRKLADSVTEALEQRRETGRMLGEALRAADESWPEGGKAEVVEDREERTAERELLPA